MPLITSQPAGAQFHLFAGEAQRQFLRGAGKPLCDMRVLCQWAAVDREAAGHQRAAEKRRVDQRQWKPTDDLPVARGDDAPGTLAGAAFDRDQPCGQVKRAAALDMHEGGDGLRYIVVAEIGNRDFGLASRVCGTERGVHAASACVSGATFCAMASIRPQQKSPSSRSSLASMADRLV